MWTVAVVAVPECPSGRRWWPMIAATSAGVSTSGGYRQSPHPMTARWHHPGRRWQRGGGAWRRYTAAVYHRGIDNGGVVRGDAERPHMH